MKKISLLIVAAWLLLASGCGHTHEFTKQVVAPTCTQDGYTEYVCACGEYNRVEEVAAAHRAESLPAQAPSCTADGLSEGSRCSVCGEILVEQTQIPATGHAYGEWVVVTPSTTTQTGLKEKVCALCAEKETLEIPLLDDPKAEEYTISYELNGGYLIGGYASTAQIGEEFLADFNQYGDGSTVTRENFQTDSHPCVKTSLANAEMLQKWHWLWVYMLSHLQELNEGKTSAYITDTYPVLERMIDGDTTAILESANARTSIRSYLHGLLNDMKGCGDLNPEFSFFSPDFSQASVREEFLKHQYELTVTLSNGTELPVPRRDGYRFVGWENKYGDLVSVAMCHGTLIARWEEIRPVEKIEITNKVVRLDLYGDYQLEWALTPVDAGEPRVRFESDDPTIASVDENGQITAHRVGTITIRIVSLSQHGHTDTMTVVVAVPEHFQIRYESNSYVTVGEQIKLNATYINRENQLCDVQWSTLDPSLATVDETGCVTGISTGVATIRASLPEDESVYQDFVVTVVSEEISEALALVLRAHESNVFVKYDLAVGAGTPNYYTDVFGSVSRLLYGHELTIDETYHQKSNDKYGSELQSRIMESIEFITVHYTGNFSTGADGEAHAVWFAEPESKNETSIHYSTGNDGVFKGLGEQYSAAHAGDGRSRETVPAFAWIDTPVEVLESDPEFPVVTITQEATFAINGRDTGIRVPEETKFGRGYVTDTKWLNDQGIGVNIKDGYYQLGTCWWCYTQVAEGRICSNGGNANSIGIESAVNIGSDLWYTWQITAQLVADIMERQGLDITRVKGHHFFSAKDCPQPLLENDMEIWWEFIELVKCEYDKITLCEDYTFDFECDSELVNEYGRVTGQALHAQVVTYRVTITRGDYRETVELASIIDGAYLD